MREYKDLDFPRARAISQIMCHIMTVDFLLKTPTIHGAPERSLHTHSQYTPCHDCTFPLKDPLYSRRTGAYRHEYRYGDHITDNEPDDLPNYDGFSDMTSHTRFSFPDPLYVHSFTRIHLHDTNSDQGGGGAKERTCSALSEGTHSVYWSVIHFSSPPTREVGGWGRVPLERWGAGVEYNFQEI